MTAPLGREMHLLKSGYCTQAAGHAKPAVKALRENVCDPISITPISTTWSICNLHA